MANDSSGILTYFARQLASCRSRRDGYAKAWLTGLQSAEASVDLRDWSQWRMFKFGTNWRRPTLWAAKLDQRARRSSRRALAYRDAEANAKWVGKELPTEAEREFAARGGLDGAQFAGRGWRTPRTLFRPRTL